MNKKSGSISGAALAACFLVGCGGGGNSGGGGTGSLLSRGIAGAFSASRSKAVNDVLDVNYVLDSAGAGVSGSFRVTAASGGAIRVADFSGGSWNSATKNIAFSATAGGATYAYNGTLNDSDTSQEVFTTGTLTYTPTTGTVVTESNVQFRKFADATLNIAGNWTGTFTESVSSVVNGKLTVITGGNGVISAAFAQGTNSGVVSGSGSFNNSTTNTNSAFPTINASGSVSGSLIGARFDFDLVTSAYGTLHFTTNGITATQITGSYTVPQSASNSAAFTGTFLLTKQ